MGDFPKFIHIVVLHINIQNIATLACTIQALIHNRNTVSYNVAASSYNISLLPVNNGAGKVFQHMNSRYILTIQKSIQ